jgi:hypothetical protein
MRNFPDKVVDKIKTHFIFHNFTSEMHFFYAIMCKNMAEPEQP